MSKFLVLAVLVAILGAATAKHWVLIVAGANTYRNYWSQSTACHAYHTVIKAGVPADNIILMSYNDVANNPRNPFKDNLVVLPNGTNFYTGCKIDYEGKDVVPELFLKVLQGEKGGVKNLIGREGRVIDSGPDDNVFITMVDHGSPGAFYFPNFVPLHATDFIAAIKSMHSKKKYKKMVVYMESCESGSMFDGLLPDNINVYGSSNANPNESGYACCWDKTRLAYVGTQYANGWEFDTDKADIKKKTLADQFEVMKAACHTPEATSHPQQYGDLSINKEVLGEYQGNVQSFARSWNDWDSRSTCTDSSENLEFAGINLVNPPMDMMDIATLARQILESQGRSREEIAGLKAELFKLMEIKRVAGELVEDIALKVLDSREVANVLAERQPIRNGVCYKEALKALDAACPGLHFGKFPFIRKYLHTVVNLCNMKRYTEVVEGIVLASASQPMC